MTVAESISTGDERWRAICERDQSARGFVYGVLTTGIYCLPGCPSRRPRRENVAFFPDAAAARAAGLRPCRRCRPDDAGLPAWFEGACRALAEAGASVAAVAAANGVSRSTFHRTFVAVLGLTPSAFRRAAKGARLRDALAGTDSVLDAVFAAGYGSQSSAYADSAAQLGLAPGAVRRRGERLSLWWAQGESALGPMVAAATREGLCLLEFLDADEAPEVRVRARFPHAALQAAEAEQAQLLAEAIAAVDAPARAAALPLDVQGTAFQQRVWTALRTLERGERISYSALAGRLGRPEATRAVAAAVGRNPVAVLVPCHRVVGRDGSLTGYRWGVARKQALLAREEREEPEG
ncbi:MAG: methylated-DNA--[protein]-cysteine S-methyltransferase [Pseudomonadales bacterium]|nr:methylated-DNA--[protein]-cysteine S-methyltransferase [Pseudomonadales bacterium]